MSTLISELFCLECHALVMNFWLHFFCWWLKSWKRERSKRAGLLKLLAFENLMVTFQAQTFIFAGNISCQLHLGQSNFLSPLLCPSLLSSNPISSLFHSFLHLYHLISSSFLSPPSPFPSALCISSPLFIHATSLPFHLLVPAVHTLSAVSVQIHFLPPWSQNHPNQTPSNSP